MNAPAAVLPPYRHTPLFPLGKDASPYRKLTEQGVRVEKMMEDAGRAMPPVTGAAAALTPPVDRRPGPFAAAGDRKSE